MKRIFLFAFFILTARICLAQPATETANHRSWVRNAKNDKIALVIGNSLYEYSSQLSEPASDAQSIASALEFQGYDVELGFNLERSELYDAVDDFAAKLKNYSVAVVYFAGHGFQVNGVNYLVPIDASPSSARAVERDCMKDTYILEAIDNPDIPKLILMDACRNNPFERSWTAQERAATPQGMRAVQALDNSLVIYATVEGKTVSDFNLFAEEYAKCIRQGGCVEAINRRVANAVRKDNPAQLIRPYGLLHTAICFGGTTRSDRDKDGLIDEKDDCPDQYGPISNRGCPEIDSDGDGILDKVDKCPEKYGLPENEGCPESKPESIPTPEGYVFVKGGSFEMGCTAEQGEDCLDWEKPVHDVFVPDFWMKTHEVTFEEYDAYCSATGKTKPEDAGWGRGKRPVINVSWHDAMAYCEWLSKQNPKWNYRLPTEAEWEYAARGGQKSKGYKYSGSNYLDDVGWYYNNSNAKTHPVGQKQPNELGLYDMSGNVREWVMDQWHGNYKNAPGNGSAWIDQGDDAARVYRGGFWGLGARGCSVSYRNAWHPGNRLNEVGFRLAVVLQ